MTFQLNLEQLHKHAKSRSAPISTTTRAALTGSHEAHAGVRATSSAPRRRRLGAVSRSLTADPVRRLRAQLAIVKPSDCPRERFPAAFVAVTSIV